MKMEDEQEGMIESRLEDARLNFDWSVWIQIHILFISYWLIRDQD